MAGALPFLDELPFLDDLPFLDKALNAMVLGVVGLFKAPVVPGVLGASVISQGRESWRDSVSGMRELWEARWAAVG